MGTARGRKRLEQSSLTRDVGGVLGEKVRARRMRDAFGDGPVTACQPHRFGAPPLDEVAGVEARQVGLLERGEDEIVQLVEAGPVPRLEPAESEGEQVQGPGAFRTVEVGGEREHALLVEAVDPLGGGAEQARVAHEQRDLLLGGRPQVEPPRQAAGEVDRLGILAGGVENERREEEPLGMLQTRGTRLPPRSSVATSSRIVSTSEKRSTCDGSIRNGSSRRRRTASASSGSARSSTSVVSRNRHVRASPVRSTSNSSRDASRLHRIGASPRSPR